MSEFERPSWPWDWVRHQNAGVRVSDVLEHLKARPGKLDNALVDKIRGLSHQLRSVDSVTHQDERQAPFP